MCARNGDNWNWKVEKVDGKVFSGGKSLKSFFRCAHTTRLATRQVQVPQKVNEKTVDIFGLEKDFDSDHLSPGIPLIEIYCIIRSCLIYPNHGLPYYGAYG